MSKRKVKDSSALTLLRREIKQVCVERQSWATACGAEKCRRQRLEVELAEARTEVAEWKIRFDRLLSVKADHSAGNGWVPLPPEGPTCEDVKA